MDIWKQCLEKLGKIRSLRIRLRTLMLGFLLLVFFLGGFFLEHSFEGVAEKLVQEKLESIKRKRKLSLDWGSIESNLFQVEISDVSIGEHQSLILDRVTIKVDLNPWSQTFLKPNRVIVGRAYSKELVDPEKKLEWFSNLYNDFLSSKDPSVGSTSSASFLPAEIILRKGTFILSDGKEDHTVIDDLSVTLYPSEKRLAWRVGKSMIKPYLSESNLEGSLQLDREDSNQIVVTAKTKSASLREPRWGVRCQVKRTTQSAACELDAKTLPATLLTRVQPYLGSSFSPSVKGTFTTQRFKTGAWVVHFDGDLTNAIVEHHAVNIGAIGPLSFGSRVTLDVGPFLKNIKSREFKVALPVRDRPGKSVLVDLSVDVTRVNANESFGFQGILNAEMPETPCDDVLRAVPRGLVSDLDGFALIGSVSGRASVRFEPGRTDLSWGKIPMNCSVLNAPQMYSSEYLNGPFILERHFGKDQVIYIPVDPSRDSYVALKDIPNRVVSTFISSEDAGFWQHNGIEPAAIEQALERNAREGRAAVGGSTITMQTVKNLFLSRDKTLARKAQEIFLAWHLERVIGKKRILEIYFNIAEFGPDLYGIGPASQRFFGVDPSALSWKQAAYLTSLLPAPVPRYQNFCRGTLTENYKGLVQGILQRMLALNRISGEDHAQASADPIRFRSSADDEACLKIQSAKVSAKKPSEWDD